MESLFDGSESLSDSHDILEYRKYNFFKNSKSLETLKFPPSKCIYFIYYYYLFL